MSKWPLIFSTTMVALIVVLSVNEVLLAKANHLKTIVSDADLWAIEREKVQDLDDNDILLLGASRMQVDIDLEVMKDHFTGRDIVQLALSGRGSSFPVLKDLIKNTSFSGMILIDESQGSLANPDSEQQKIIDHFYAGYSLDRKLNKLISMEFQQLFLFLNPNSNSERLWGNMIGNRQLPPPMFTMTWPSREQTSFFDLTDTRWIYDLRIAGVRRGTATEPTDPEDWLSEISVWVPLMEQFKERGGQIVFVHMPYSRERWILENDWMPKDKYWDHAMKILNAKAIHFAAYPQLMDFELPDTSHLDADSKAGFTKALCQILNKITF